MTEPSSHPLAQLQALRRAKIAFASVSPPPPDLNERIRAALDEEDAGGEEAEVVPIRQPLYRRRGLWLAVAAAIAAIFIVTLLPPSQTVPERVAEEFRSYQGGELALDFESSSAPEIESWLAQRSLPFHARVIDLGMMSYLLAGAHEHVVGDLRLALMPYTGAGGRTLVCQMYAGRLEDLPASDEVRETDDFTFHIYHHDGVTLAFWQEGDVVCVLASNIDSGELIELALAQAMVAA
ncbi:MAG: hypothetical protein VYE73_13950 [Acidobacteriota bacterium]|nr:hypothetical protein [Acidobacteriota bacterium]